MTPTKLVTTNRPIVSPGPVLLKPVAAVCEFVLAVWPLVPDLLDEEAGLEAAWPADDVLELAELLADVLAVVEAFLGVALATCW